ncbi:MFS transporter [Myroides sp. M-43]|uniref:MFS transporter n=1 Tax=Myroides oncorhynchi TaxID=2893756 RepID=UPI001E45DD22|nr:MFS transporter [Myroides oncorhynchi]MCC9043353.1 MFS transporter [Myroides oncorhynchi]
MTQTNNKQYSRIRLAVSLFFFSHGLILSSWASRIPTIKTYLGISEAELGTLLLLMPIGQISTMPLSAKLINQYSSKTIVKFGFLIYPIILLILGLSTTYIQLAIGLFLFGVAGNLCNISINTQGVELESLTHKPMMSSFHGVWSISSFVGALIGLLMFSLKLTTSIHFAIVMIIIFTIWVLNFKLLVHTSPTNKEEQDKGSIFKHLDKTLIQLGLIGFLSMAIEGAMFDWSGVYFQDIVKAPEQLIIIGYTSFVLMMAIGQFLGDYLVTKLGRKHVIQLCGTFMSTGLIIAVLTPNIWVCTFAFMIVGLGSSCSVPTVFGIAGKHSKVSASISLTLVSTISFLGFLIGPPAIGFIAQWLDLRYSYALFAMFGIIMVIMAIRLKVLQDN